MCKNGTFSAVWALVRGALGERRPKGNTTAALLYEDFREQCYIIGASPDPISAALQRADEIESYPQDEGSLLFPYPPFIVRGISAEERIAAKDIVWELRSMAETLKLQSSGEKPLG